MEQGNHWKLQTAIIQQLKGVCIFALLIQEVKAYCLNFPYTYVVYMMIKGKMYFKNSDKVFHAINLQELLEYTF